MKIKFSLILFMLVLMTGHVYSQTFQWVDTTGGPGRVRYVGTVTDLAGNVIVAGYFNQSADFDPGAASQTITSAGDFDCFVQKFDASGSLLWAKTFGDIGADQPSSLEVDADGNVLLTGTFEDTVDFDPGPGVFRVGAYHAPFWAPTKDIFILKLDPAGNYLWAETFGNRHDDVINAISTDASRNVYVAGYFHDTIDFDFGPGTQIYTTPLATPDTLFTASFVLKLDAGGNFIWVDTLPTNPGWIINPALLKVDGNGDIVFQGYFEDTLDFDPGPGVFMLASPPGTISGFVEKIDNSGNFIWAKSLICSYGWHSPHTVSMTFDANNNIYSVGDYDMGVIDFDPGPGTAIPACSGNFDFFVHKLDANGNFKWVKTINGPAYEQAYGISTDVSGHVYFTGTWDEYTATDSIDLDPNIATDYHHTQDGAENIFVEKLDTAGNFLWAQSLEMSNNSGCIPSAIALSGPNLYISGYYVDTIDFDFGPAETVYAAVDEYSDGSGFLFKWQQDICDNLALVIDSATDVTCAMSGYITAHALGGVAPYAYNWNTSPVTDSTTAYPIHHGIYQVTVIDSNACLHKAKVLIGEPDNISGFDLDVDLTHTFLHDGFPATIFLDALNDGCVSTSGQLSLVFGRGSDYVDATPAPDVIHGDTLTWNFTGLTDGVHFTPKVNILVWPAPDDYDDNVHYTTIITPIAGDVDTSNNVKPFSLHRFAALDPNLKTVYPVGVCSQHYVHKNQKLTYTIHFQNTGSADAVNIYLLDSLDADLDINTLKVVAKSHEPLITEILSGNVLKFRFDGIHLPDSTSNEPLSHGYVMYEIKAKVGLPSVVTVENRAGIYFDFNEPVYTNTVMNKMLSVLPTVNPVISQTGHQLNASPASYYQWVICDSAHTHIPGATGNTFTPPGSTGIYALEGTIGSCTETSDCFVYDITGMPQEEPMEQITVYPNPTHGLFYLDLSSCGSAVKVEISDITGRVVDTKSLNGGSKSEINLIGPAGIYTVKVYTRTGEKTFRLAKN